MSSSDSCKLSDVDSFFLSLTGDKLSYQHCAVKLKNLLTTDEKNGDGDGSSANRKHCSPTSMMCFLLCGGQRVAQVYPDICTSAMTFFGCLPGDFNAHSQYALDFHINR